MRPDRKSKTPIPPCLPGFEKISRFIDKHTGLPMAKILPGEYYVTCNNETVGTVLGSCISACIRDRVYGIGGMNHFMLPLDNHVGEALGTTKKLSNATRYGSYAMEHLITDILKNGGKRKNLEVKLFGGASVIKGVSDVGQQNSDFVREYLDAEGMQIAGEDLCGPYPRKVIYFPKTGKVRVKRIAELHNNTILEREKSYQASIDKAPVEGEIELF